MCFFRRPRDASVIMIKFPKSMTRQSQQIRQFSLSAIAIGMTFFASPFAAWSEESKQSPLPPFPFHKIPQTIETQLSGPAGVAWKSGEIEFRQLKYKEAIDSFKKVSEIKPDVSRVHTRLGSALAASGDYDAAAREMNKAIELDGKDYLPHLVLGRIILVQKGEKAGVAEATKAYNIDPWACAAFLEYANKDRFDPQKWFVLANYWKEMEHDAAAAASSSANGGSATAGSSTAGSSTAAPAAAPAATSAAAPEKTYCCPAAKAAAERGEKEDCDADMHAPKTTDAGVSKMPSP